jgi:DNA polymerase V
VIESEVGEKKNEKLMNALDILHSRHGKGTVRFGAEGGKDTPWHMKHPLRSPRYTSAWEDLPVVRIL